MLRQNCRVHQTNKFKRQKSTRHRVLPESLSLLSLPSFAVFNNDSSSKTTLPDETAGDADDEKDIQDESITNNRSHRYHHRMQQQSLTSDEEEEEEVLSENPRAMMDFMDRVSQC